MKSGGIAPIIVIGLGTALGLWGCESGSEQMEALTAENKKRKAAEVPLRKSDVNEKYVAEPNCNYGSIEAQTGIPDQFNNDHLDVLKILTDVNVGTWRLARQFGTTATLENNVCYSLGTPIDDFLDRWASFSVPANVGPDSLAVRVAVSDPTGGLIVTNKAAELAKLTPVFNTTNDAVLSLYDEAAPLLRQYVVGKVPVSALGGSAALRNAELAPEQRVFDMIAPTTNLTKESLNTVKSILDQGTLAQDKEFALMAAAWLVIRSGLAATEDKPVFDRVAKALLNQVLELRGVNQYTRRQDLVVSFSNQDRARLYFFLEDKYRELHQEPEPCATNAQPKASDPQACECDVGYVSKKGDATDCKPIRTGGGGKKKPAAGGKKYNPFEE